MVFWEKPHISQIVILGRKLGKSKMYIQRAFKENMQLFRKIPGTLSISL